MEKHADRDAILHELQRVLPLERAMATLVGVGSEPTVEAIDFVQKVTAPPIVKSALWLYFDDLERSHSLSQDIHTPSGSYWHAIMHRREGDFWNSKYWFRKVGHHPVIGELGYDPFQFVDACEADGGRNAPELLATQRNEWVTLFNWCLREASLD